jgi:hypothetical protein
MEMELVDGGEKLLRFCFRVCVFFFSFQCVVVVNISDGTKFLEDKDKKVIVLKVLRILMCIISIQKIHICNFFALNYCSIACCSHESYSPKRSCANKNKLSKFCSSCVSTFGISNTYFPLPSTYKFLVNWCVDDSFPLETF